MICLSWNGKSGTKLTGTDNSTIVAQYIMGRIKGQQDGLESLQMFLHQYGVDRGNWGEVVDYAPLTDYLEALQEIQPESSRQRLLHGPIQEIIGEFAVTMLEDELSIMEDESHSEDSDI